MYFQEPNGVKLELHVDNHFLPGGPRSFYSTPTFAANPIGITYDPEDLVRRHAAGESEEDLLSQAKLPSS